MSKQFRRRRHRRRPRRLHRRDPRGAARLQRPPASTSGRTTRASPAPGGTCTNVGCIPSKALLQSSENFEHAGHALRRPRHRRRRAWRSTSRKMLARKDTVVKQNNDGILYLFKKNKVTFFHGRGSFVEGRRRRLRDQGRRRGRRDARRPSTSSSPPARTPRALPGAPFDEENDPVATTARCASRPCRRSWA